MEIKTTTCENCRAEFSCAAETGNCWCFKVEVEQVVLTGLSEKFERCLCRACLVKLSDDSLFADSDFTDDKISR